MKKLFPLLLAYVFMSSQSWALSGGPFLGGGTQGATVGTFAGVLTPEDGDEDDASLDDAGTVEINNSLGVFSLGIPTVGLGSGLFVYFTEGRTYTGTIVGVADPDLLTFQGLVKAQYNITFDIGGVFDGDTGAEVADIDLSIPAGYANGSIDADIIPLAFAGLATRIEGTSTLSVQDADPDTGLPAGEISTLNLRVTGYKQSDTSDVTADLDAFGLPQTSTQTTN